ncbi:MAG: hypothetical protein EAZ95_17970 [Bacteroidetes bacterium]|nr:MAG: hypothetical protein EAZ95_17970 [Bacteroidota bacterium]
MLLEYAKLQFRIINRAIDAFGLPPSWGYVLGLGLFVAFSGGLFAKVAYAEFVYVAVACLWIARLSEIKRNDFLQTCFVGKAYRRVRLFENAIAVSPFALFLLVQGAWIGFVLVWVACVVGAFYRVRAGKQAIIPTPFGRVPFEFVIGFRGTFLFLFLLYGVGWTATAVGNGELAVLTILLIFYLCLNYYNLLESDYWVWSHNLTPRQFLHQKIRQAFLQSTCLVLPVCLPMLVVFFDYAGVIALFLVLGYAFLAFAIIQKYTVFPEMVNVGHALLMVICIMFFPILFIVLPTLYARALKNLAHIL